MIKEEVENTGLTSGWLKSIFTLLFASVIILPSMNELKSRKAGGIFHNHRPKPKPRPKLGRKIMFFLLGQAVRVRTMHEQGMTMDYRA